MNELGNCPFCGGAPEMCHAIEWYVLCTECDAASCKCRTEDEAKQRWNRRVAVTASVACEFYREVCRRAEAKMELTGRLEGAHYAAMQEVLREHWG